MSRPFRYQCPGCYIIYSGQPGHYYCKYCHENQAELRELVRDIQQAFPDLYRESPTYILARLWLGFCKLKKPSLVPSATKLVQKFKRSKQLRINTYR